MYYILNIKRQTEKDLILKGSLYNSNNEMVKAIFYDGKPVKDQLNGMLTIIVNEKDTTKGDLTDKLAGSAGTAGFVLMINQLVKKVFDDLGIENMEYFPLDIKGKNINTKNYFIGNVLGKIDCIDAENSEIEYKPNGNVEDVEKLVLDEPKIPKDLKIFLLGKFTSAEFVVHQSVKDAIEAKKITGFTFTPIDKFTK